MHPRLEFRSAKLSGLESEPDKAWVQNTVIQISNPYLYYEIHYLSRSGYPGWIWTPYQNRIAEFGRLPDKVQIK